MIKKALIVDDSESDRKSIKKIFQKAIPTIEFSEASNIGMMYQLLGPDVDLLIQDISLQRDIEPDSTGLNALYDVIEFFSGLPIIIITGHFFDKVKEFQSGSLWKKKNIIGYRDKLNFSKSDAEDLIILALDFIKDRSTSEEMQVRLDNLEKRGKELEAQLRKHELENAMIEQAILYKQAFIERDFSTSIEAEAKITGGNANYSAFRICKEIEMTVKTIVKDTPVENQSFFQKVQYIRKISGMPNELFNSINDAWAKRNALIHDQKNVTLKGAYKLFHVLTIFKGII